MPTFHEDGAPLPLIRPKSSAFDGSFSYFPCFLAPLPHMSVASYWSKRQGLDFDIKGSVGISQCNSNGVEVVWPGFNHNSIRPGVFCWFCWWNSGQHPFIPFDVGFRPTSRFQKKHQLQISMATLGHHVNHLMSDQLFWGHWWSLIIPKWLGMDCLTQEYRTKSYTRQSIDTGTSLTCIKNLNKVHQPRLVVETLGLFMPCRMVQKCRQEEETLRITGIKSPWAIQLDVGTEFHEATYKHKCFVFFWNQVTKLWLATPQRWRLFVVYIPVVLLKRLIHKFQQNTEFYDSAQNTLKLQRPTSQQCFADPFAPQADTLGFLVPIAHLQTSPLGHKNFWDKTLEPR